jgi:2-keto-4-pentenoate hydratase/2-oxohepta-3-ene-1,7-dioic acid hydratase in catechol pathway
MRDATDDLVKRSEAIEATAVLPLPAGTASDGSPAHGYGRNPKVFMKAGDTIEVEVSGIGVLSNPVKAA